MRVFLSGLQAEEFLERVCQAVAAELDGALCNMQLLFGVNHCCTSGVSAHPAGAPSLGAAGGGETLPEWSHAKSLLQEQRTQTHKRPAGSGHDFSTVGKRKCPNALQMTCV